MSYDSSYNAEASVSDFLNRQWMPGWSPSLAAMLARGFQTERLEGARVRAETGRRGTLRFDEGTEGASQGTGGFLFDFTLPPLPSFGGSQVAISPQFTTTAYFLTPQELLGISDPILQLASGGPPGTAGGTGPAGPPGGFSDVFVETVNTAPPAQIPGEIEFENLTPIVTQVLIEGSELVARRSMLQVGIERVLNGSDLTVRLYLNLADLGGGSYNRTPLTVCAASVAERAEAPLEEDRVMVGPDYDILVGDGGVLLLAPPEGTDLGDEGFWDGLACSEEAVLTDLTDPLTILDLAGGLEARLLVADDGSIMCNADGPLFTE